MFNWLKKSKSQMSNTDVTVSKQSAIPRQPIKRSNPHRILICDDAAFIRLWLKNMLTQNGYEVIAEAQDGLEAIERYYEFKPDLVFMDITMPKMDGIDATITIKEMDRRANIVVHATMGQEELVIEAIRSGAIDFILKPFSHERILKTMTEIEPRLNNLYANRTIKRIKPIYRDRTANITPEQNATSPEQEQSKQARTEDTMPPQSVLDVQELFNYIKTMPVKWEYANPNISPNKELQQLCNSFLTGGDIPKCYSSDALEALEYNIQKKRARTSNKPDYNKAMETNMLFELYKYSYCMNVVKVLVDRKNDAVRINISELMGLIQEDCHKRLENLEYEKRNNPAIQAMLQKYQYDTQKVKMIVNDDVEGREYDYIYAYLMTTTLKNIINYILNSEIDTANGYQPTMQVVRQYPSSDLTAALDAYISSFIGMTLNLYTNGGSIPRRPL